MNAIMPTGIIRKHKKGLTVFLSDECDNAYRNNQEAQVGPNSIFV
jgi:hypothetical protein